ncbi:Uncharacterized protein, PA2063/DUF2235 family [Aliiroseovarius halocynthiae]|uniref:DUF2235 domain-containing protein n=1 Tax=Aliiroseovarius halocynthiae TaxID=985055 RepID=A0A545SUF1_9RHOB|nr:DUF2235 domain-containing protein [Aliiroseovarius halocynthiae]TQV68601.1 DUF2235 domain-containing protein [Aliiroseovarius halocynthiae]SMR71013.1 Uncharacterized protein, PA2063/DUF2235 family [Aliiroseovarius halocynthiae]
MKRIAIFCDGTWNRSDAQIPTHVLRIAQAVRPTARDGVTQVVHYLPGVGSGQGVTKLSRFLDRVLGGALGWGLDDRILEAYRALLFTYEPGDQIYIFGFSRGAYTARSLAGMIRTAGILPSNRTDLIPEAMRMYRTRDGRRSHPDSDTTMAARLAMSPKIATSPKDAAWRKDQGIDCHLLDITYVGVWDTVGALGVPAFLGPLARFVNARYAFHDADLSRSVGAARHAVAIDERRKHFPPALWTNLDTLNGETTDSNSRYQQLWFAGNHGIVGGSGAAPELSAFPTAWIVAGAQERDLEFDPFRLQPLLMSADVNADDCGAALQPSWRNLWGALLCDRDLLRDPDSHEIPARQISGAAKERVRQTSYRPRTLDPVIEDLLK